MEMRTRIVTAPTVDPITAAEAKAHLRIDHTDHDTLIANYIKASKDYVEAVCGRALVTQTRAVAYMDWPNGDVFVLPYPPIQSVTSLIYTDTDGTAHTMASSEYSADVYSDPGRIVLCYGESWPSDAIHFPDFPIEITYACGYAANGQDLRANIPQAIKDAMLLDVELRYDRPSDPNYVRRMEDAIKSLLDHYRVTWKP